MARIVVSRVADRDAADILSFLTQEAGLIVAEQYVRRFEDLYQRLADHPESCRARPQLGRDIRIGVVTPYLVVYRYSRSDNLAVIIRILHGHRQLTRDALRERQI